MFSRIFIHRPILATVVSLVIVLLGGISIPLLPIENTPNITPPTVGITATYPGANASVVERTVTQPIEEQVNGIENMEYISSKSSDDGTCEITVTFEVGTDIDMATVLVQNRVALAEPKLPEDVKSLGISVEKRSTTMTLVVCMTSPDDSRDSLYISNYASTRVSDVLARVPGVGDVAVLGARDFGMRLWLDPNHMAARELTTQEIVDALREQNVQVAAGAIGQPPVDDDQDFQYTISTKGRLSTVEDFQNIIVKTTRDGRLVRLDDVARVELGSASYNWEVELNGKPAIALAVYQSPGSNALQVAQGVMSEMERLSQGFPEGLDYVIPFDTTRFIQASIEEVVKTLVIAVVLVVLTVFVFLQDWRASLIPALTIPVSLIGTFGVMLALGVSMNTLSLFGIVLAIGIVVDDAIVVVENTIRLMTEEKLDSKKAAEKAMEQVTGPVMATTLVLLAVFVPTALMGGITGRLYQQFAITISVATVFSSINALTLSPALCGVFLRPPSDRPLLPFRIFNRVFDWSTGVYMGGVGLTVKRLGLVAVAYLVFLALTAYGFVSVPTGFIPNEDQGYVFVNARLPSAAALGRSAEAQKKIDQVIQQTPGIDNVIGIVGYSFMDGVIMPNAASSIVMLKPWDERTESEESLRSILISLRGRLHELQEAQAIAFPPPPIMGIGNASGFEMKLQDRGDAGSALLATFAEDIVQRGTEHPMLTRMNNNFRPDVPQLFVEIDRTQAKTLEVPLTTIFSSLQAFLGSQYVNDFDAFGRSYRVMVQADQPFRKRVEDINRIQVRDREGNMIPLSTFVAVRDTVGPNVIFRHNLYPSADITGQAASGVSSGEAVQAMQEIANQTLPDTFGFEWAGMTYQQIEAGNLVPILFSLALVFIYLVLAAQYESWSIPLAILFFVPLALLGALGATVLLGLDNNVYTQIGMVLLIGISAKTAILIVEFAKQIHERDGQSVRDAALAASHLRFRPILMTAFSFILGVSPLLLSRGAGAAARVSLGSAVLGGMLLATIAGVFLIPSGYVIVQSISNRVRGKHQHAAAPATTES